MGQGSVPAKQGVEAGWGKILSIPPSSGEQGCWMPSSLLSCRLPTFHLASAPAPSAGQIILSDLQAPPQRSLTPCTPPSMPGYPSCVLKVLGWGVGVVKDN